MQGTQYKNPPITEALVEFRFRDEAWTWAIPGRVGEHLGGDYHGPPRQRMQATVKIGPQPVVEAGGTIDRVYFPTAEGTRLVGIGMRTLSVHALRPYCGWDDLQSRVAAALRAYQATVLDSHVERVGVRYINAIVVPTAILSDGFSEYVAMGPQFPQEIPAKVERFVHRGEAVYPDGAKLAVTVTTAPAPTPDTTTIVVDLDLVQVFDPPLSGDAVLAFVDSLHEREGAAFEAVIRDGARRLFNQ